MTTLTDEIKNAFRYDPQTGILYWCDTRRQKKAKGIAGSKGKDGYVRVMFKYRMYCAHQIIWLLVYNEWPGSMLDHIDRNPSNNKIDNLRKTNYSSNAFNSGIWVNNTSGARGVGFEPRTGRWFARCQKRYIGTFDTFEEAKLAAQRAREVFNV